MKTFESVDRVTHMMWGAQQTIARLTNELNSISDATFKGTSQEELKDLHRKLNRLVNHDMRDFINKREDVYHREAERNIQVAIRDLIQAECMTLI